MTEQIPFHRTSTLKHRASRTSSVIVQDNTIGGVATTNTTAATTTTGSIVVPAGGGGSGLQQQSSVRRPSVMQKYMGEIEFTGLNQTARVRNLC
ncbi:Transient receptor potential cation channel subfamily M member 3 [Schistosoma japonicum]|nr:Transient receptor potential cation channel subfamily M member 3 [Schistosoma japonicum]